MPAAWINMLTLNTTSFQQHIIQSSLKYVIFQPLEHATNLSQRSLPVHHTKNSSCLRIPNHRK